MPIARAARTIVVSVALLCVCAPAFAASQIETAKLFYQTFNTGQPDLLDQVLAPDWVDFPLNPGQGPGRDGFKPLTPLSWRF